jgi:hypothetical protein
MGYSECVGTCLEAFAILAAILDNNYGNWGRKRRVFEVRVSILSHMATRTAPWSPLRIIGRFSSLKLELGGEAQCRRRVGGLRTDTETRTARPVIKDSIQTNDLFKSVTAMICFTSLAATPALASDEADVLSRMQQTIDAANRNIDAPLASNFMPSVVLVDDLAPYVFRGPAADAILEWSKAYGADSAKNSITDFSMKLLKPRRVKVSGDRAYIVLPAVYGFKQRLKPMQKRGTITATLERVDKKWLIATWSWAGQ